VLRLCDQRSAANASVIDQFASELFEFVQKAAERETRPVSMQIRHYIAEAAHAPAILRRISSRGRGLQHVCGRGFRFGADEDL